MDLAKKIKKKLVRIFAAFTIDFARKKTKKKSLKTVP